MSSLFSIDSATQEIPAMNCRSNSAYLAWEMKRLQKRARAFVTARDSGDEGSFLALVEQQRKERIEVIAERRKAMLQGVTLMFELIAHRYQLQPIDEDILAALLSLHLSANTRHHLLHAQGDPSKPHLELGFLADLLSPSRDLLSFRAWGDANSRLVNQGLIQVVSTESTSRSRLAAAVTTPHFLAAAITGEVAVDEALQSCATLKQAESELYDMVLPRDTQRHVKRFVDSSRREGNGMGWKVLIRGERQVGKSMLAEAFAKMQSRMLFTVHCERLTKASSVEHLLTVSEHNARFYRAVWHLSRPEALLDRRPDVAGELFRLIENYPGMVVLESSTGREKAPESSQLELLKSCVDTAIDVGFPDAPEREQLWESHLPPSVEFGDDVMRLEELAQTYEIPGGQIQSAVHWALRRADAQGRTGVLTHDDLEVGANVQLRSRIGKLSNTSRVKLRLEHLVLPDEPMEKVTQFLAACRNRKRLMGEWGFGQRLATGRGLIALFRGEPGTGKTLTAEILANELGMQLQIVSLSKVVSKWVGETEKNIQEIFSEARAQHSMLLFDEADALFGKRVNVERSQDHFQNMGVNNLLQEIERFDGVVILTTNHDRNMDPAFERRILYKVDFPMPGDEHRALLWKSLIPTSAPREEDIDFDALAEAFQLSGGQIKNAIVRASYACLEHDRALHFDALYDAGCEEAIAAGTLMRRS